MTQSKMKTREHKRYSDEFKARAVRLSQQSEKSTLQVAKELGISDSALAKWRKAAGVIRQQVIREKTNVQLSTVSSYRKHRAYQDEIVQSSDEWYLRTLSQDYENRMLGHDVSEEVVHQLNESQGDVNKWLLYYNQERCHSSHYRYGKTPWPPWQDSTSLAREKRA